MRAGGCAGELIVLMVGVVVGSMLYISRSL